MSLLSSNGEFPVNGIDAITGEYLLPALDYEEILEMLKAERRNTPRERANSQSTWLRSLVNRATLGAPPGVRLEDVAQAGWGIVFSEAEDPVVKEAFAPLVKHRLDQVGSEKRTRVLEYKSGESAERWLAREPHRVSRGSISPSRVPYYLLMIGAPEKIPFSFCNQLDVEYAVGILQMDSVSDYEQYVRGVISYEIDAKIANKREAVFFATRHPGDRATALSADHLVTPIIKGDPSSDDSLGLEEKWGYRVRTLLHADATKAALGDVFKPNASCPAFVFTATHGVGFPRDHCDQAARQGALLCQDWPGAGPVSAEHVFAAADLTADDSATGLIMFSFACFGAGTPLQDRFMHRAGKQPPIIADPPFISALPKKLLSLPNGSALAFVGHIERAWGSSILTPNATAPYENAIGRIFLGEPIGHAMKDFNDRYAALSTDLTGMIEKINWGEDLPAKDVAATWLLRNDAEGYVVLGDPAVKLRVNDLNQSRVVPCALKHESQGQPSCG